MFPKQLGLYGVLAVRLLWWSRVLANRPFPVNGESRVKRMISTGDPYKTRVIAPRIYASARF